MKDGSRNIPGNRRNTGVVYVGCVPRGFDERRMKQFFSQFGKVLRLRISRSKKTGKPKGYAFIMFEYDEVAKIVADTMNNYLMFQKLMKCRHVPPEEVHPNLFKGHDRRFTEPKSHVVSMRRHNSNKTNEVAEAIAKRTKYKIQKKMNKLAALGIDYSMQVGDETISYREKPVKPITEKKSAASPDDDSDESDQQMSLSTPAKQVLLEDSSDEDISMKTPPGSVRVKKSKSKVTKPKESKQSSMKTKNTRTKLMTGLKNNKVLSAKTKGKLGTLGSKVRVGKRKK